MTNLFEEITHCANVKSCFEDKNKKHPCSKIVLSQSIEQFNEFMLPEPWSGNIKTAPILFISDSTIISEEEEYPTYSWPKYLIRDFFNNRFSGGQKKWVKDGLYPLCKDGTYKKQWNRLWSACINRTLELTDSISIAPGIDFALTELTRCRAKKHLRGNASSKECSSLYLKKVIAASSAQVIVCMGESTRKYLCDEYEVLDAKEAFCLLEAGGKQRYVAFLPQYHNKGPRAFNEVMEDDYLNTLKSLL